MYIHMCDMCQYCFSLHVLCMYTHSCIPCTASYTVEPLRTHTPQWRTHSSKSPKCIHVYISIDFCALKVPELGTSRYKGQYSLAHHCPAWRHSTAYNVHRDRASLRYTCTCIMMCSMFVSGHQRREATTRLLLCVSTLYSCIKVCHCMIVTGLSTCGLQGLEVLYSICNSTKVSTKSV